MLKLLRVESGGIEVIGRSEIIKGLKPLFEKAKRENLWFYNENKDIWFSPEELIEEQKQGYYMWGVVNWELRSPYEKLHELEDQLTYLKSIVEKQVVELKTRIEGGKI